ncbi:MAG: hypothetical protein ACI9T8_000631 [Candidatus Saccharimonadales bacterium]|jgi:hypothetical protein
MKELLASMYPDPYSDTNSGFNPVVFLYQKYIEAIDEAIYLLQRLDRNTRADTGKVVDLEKNALVEDGIRSDETPQEAASDVVGSGFSGGNNKKPKKSKRSKSRRKAMMAIGASAAIGLSVAGVAYLPAILMGQITSKIGDAFMDRVNHAVEIRTEKLIGTYVQRVIAPSLTTCGTAISKDCDAFRRGQGPISRLYTSWRDNGIETKLLDKHGLDFKLSTNGNGRVNVFKTNTNGVRGLVGEYGSNSVGREVSKLIKADVNSAGVLERKHIRSLIATKYRSAKWCFFACKKKDQLGDIKLSAKKRLQLKLINRVANPISSKLGTLMACTLSGCSDTDLKNSTDTLARELANTVDADYITEAVEKLDARGNPRLGQFLVQELLEKMMKSMGVQAGARTAIVSSIPIAGQIYLGIVIMDLVDRFDQKIKDRAFSNYLYESVNAPAAVEFATNVNVLSEEAHTGNMSLEESGAVFSTFNRYNQSRLNSAMVNDQVGGFEACEDTTLSGTTDPVVCPEKNLRPTLAIEEIRNDPFIDQVFTLANVYGRCAGGEVRGRCIGVRPRTIIRPVLDGINWAAGEVIGFVFDGIQRTVDLATGGWMTSTLDWVTMHATNIMTAIAKKIFPVAINAVAEHGEAVVQYAAGTDVIASQFAEGVVNEDGTEIGLGGKALSPEEQVSLDFAIADRRAEEISTQSTFARYFDASDPQSLLATSLGSLASVLPVSGQTLSISASFGGFASNVMSNFGFSNRASADLPEDRSELFGVTQFGIPAGDPALTVDPESLTPEVCADYASARENSKQVDPATGREVYTLTNPCQLDETLVDTLTKVFDLDEEGTINEPEENTLLTYPPGVSTDHVLCSPGTSLVNESIEGLDNNSRVNLRTCDSGGITVSSVISGRTLSMLTAARAAGHNLGGTGYRSSGRQIELRAQNCGPTDYDIWHRPSSECRPPTARPGTSNHEIGIAVDLTANGTIIRSRSSREFIWLSANASRFGLYNLPSEPWHWSTDGG